MLVERILHLIEHHGARLEEIVAITFTEKAAAELKARLAGALGGRDGGDGPGERLWTYDLAQARMPFGKYQGRRLIDLPERYLVWFAGQGFPDGQLGRRRWQVRATFAGDRIS